MTDLTFSSDITVELVDCMATDSSVARSARVSNVGRTDLDNSAKMRGLINYLMTAKHGSPFEHNAFTFYISAPIFVFREWQRHRISSFNERSGRYSELEPKFYVPAADRKLINVGTSARPEFVEGTEAQQALLMEPLRETAFYGWEFYQRLLKEGVANEVARLALPLNIYSEMYWTVNARSLMNFLSLRVDSPDASVRTRPQWEIQMGAEQVEAIFAEKMPLTHKAFVDNGRMAP